MESKVFNNESEIVSRKWSFCGGLDLTKGSSSLLGQGSGSRADRINSIYFVTVTSDRGSLNGHFLSHKNLKNVVEKSHNFFCVSANIL